MKRTQDDDINSSKSTLRRRKGTNSTDPSKKHINNNDNKTLKKSQHDDIDPSAKYTKHSNQHSIPFSININAIDIIWMLILFIVAFAVRFYKLASIPTVIFDEVHYLNFNTYVLEGKYFFDVNPVFGKLLIAHVAKLLGFIPGTIFKQLGERIGSEWQVISARVPAAIFGALTVPVFYRVCRLLKLTTHASLMGSIFILFDSMHVIQSRITMVDSVLVFFTCISLLFALMMWNAKNVVVIEGSRVTVREVFNLFILMILTGICCGLSVSVRWTAFATPALIFTISLYGIAPFCREPLKFVELLILYSSAIGSYMASFAVFISTLSQTGTGDGFMSKGFQACLEGNQHFTGWDGCKMSLWQRIIELNKTIFRYSKGIRGNDKWGSSWFQWIINWRGALYYREKADDIIAFIYVLMNPMMVILIDGLIGLFIAVLFYSVRYRKQVERTDAFKQHLKRGSALFFGWVGSMLPTMVVFRSGPVYQYLPGLFFAQALAAVGFDLIPRKLRSVCAILMTLAQIAAFVYWSPWVYGVGLSPADHMSRRWLPRWD